MSCFDNIQIQDLPLILTKETMTERYYSLIPIAAQMINSLVSAGIEDSNTFIDKMGDSEDVAHKTDLSIETLNCLYGLLTFHRFRARPLREIQSIDKEYVNLFIKNGIKTTEEIIFQARDQGKRDELAKWVKVPESIINKILCLSDLMRLPGVKDIRASLYYDCGYKNIKEISLQQFDIMKQHISEFIIKSDTKKSVPLSKELLTQIAWAKVYPKIISFEQ